MTSFFRRSFKRPSAFDSGNTHLMMSIQSLSVIIVGAFSCLRKRLSCSYKKLCTPLQFALRCRCSFVCFEGKVFRLRPQDALAFPILVPQHTFQSAPAENEPFVSTSILT
jgi:hypothetical protein